MYLDAAWANEQGTKELLIVAKALVPLGASLVRPENSLDPLIQVAQII